MTAWLLSVIVVVLPERDPSSIRLWAVVAVGSAALAVAALVATMRGARSRRRARGVLVVLSAAAELLGVSILASLLTPANGHFEGYLLLIALVLGVEGVLGLGWLVTSRRR